MIYKRNLLAMTQWSSRLSFHYDGGIFNSTLHVQMYWTLRSDKPDLYNIPLLFKTERKRGFCKILLNYYSKRTFAFTFLIPRWIVVTKSETNTKHKFKEPFKFKFHVITPKERQFPNRKPASFYNARSFFSNTSEQICPIMR